MTMKTFKEYLDEAKSRSEEVLVTEFMKWADTHASSYLKGSHFLFRGSRSTGRNFMIGSSVSETPRKSANTNNNYTLWMDNSPAFRGWPKRSQSWIVTDEPHTAAAFGKVSLLVVADNAKIGLVGYGDLWDVEMGKGGTSMSLVQFNGDTERILNALGKGHNEDYRSLITAMMDARYKDISNLYKPGGSGLNESILAITKMMTHNKAETIYDLWEKLLVPELFEKTTGANVSKKPTSGEAWVEGDIAFIPYAYSYASDEERKAVLEWASKYPHFKEALEHAWTDAHEIGQT